jgi:hypothetical protein
MEVSYSIFMEEARQFKTEPLYPREKVMANLPNGNIPDLKTLDVLRKSFIRRFVQRYYGICPRNDSNELGKTVFEDEYIIEARLISDWEGMHGVMEARWGFGPGSSSSSGRSDHSDEYP